LTAFAAIVRVYPTRVELAYQGWEALAEPGRSAQLRAFRERLGRLARMLEPGEAD